MPILLIPIALLITLPITGLAFYKRENLPGLALCGVLAVLAWFLGSLLPLVGGPILGILLGITLANLVLPHTSWNPKAPSKKVLQTAIVLLGFQMNLRTVLELSGQALALILLTIATALTTAYFAGKFIGVRGREQTLIGVGTAICGGSAIAAVSPILDAKENEMVSAISTVFLLDLIAVLLFPMLGHLFGMTDLQFGAWAGSAINDTSSVIAAGFAYSETAGGFAMIVKLSRTLMIIPLCILLSLWQTRKAKNTNAGFRLHKTFPWFVLGFLLASLLRTTEIIPSEATAFWGAMGRFLLVIAMVGIGLSCNIRDLIRHGKKPILLGACCSMAVASVAFGALRLFGF